MPWNNLINMGGKRAITLRNLTYSITKRPIRRKWSSDIKTLAKRKALYISREDFRDESDQITRLYYMVDAIDDNKLELISISEDVVTTYPLEIEELINKRYETKVGEETLFVPIKLWLKKGFDI